MIADAVTASLFRGPNMVTSVHRLKRKKKAKHGDSRNPRLRRPQKKSFHKPAGDVQMNTLKSYSKYMLWLRHTGDIKDKSMLAKYKASITSWTENVEMAINEFSKSLIIQTEPSLSASQNVFLCLYADQPGSSC